MVNYQSILYPIVRSYLNSSDDITKFKDLCEELATIKTVEDCEQKSKILCEYLHNECNIQNVTKSKIKLKYVQELGSVLNQIKNSKLVNDSLSHRVLKLHLLTCKHRVTQHTYLLKQF